MKRTRPGALSVRSVNEYRRRNTLAYLGLRYYLDSEATRTDRWAREVAAGFILARTEPVYCLTPHFKERNGQGNAKHRPIFVPSPSEALAEAALLQECALSAAFSNPPVVFSYPLSARGDRSRSFCHYMPGLRSRQAEIAKASELCKNGIVQYLDIKGFYSSIPTDLAAASWHHRSEAGLLPKRFRELGAKLIADQANVREREGKGILTGPMFSHLLGNLVLRGMDEDLSKCLPVSYFRYVDDIVLVGEPGAVKRSVGVLRARLNALGLELHDDQSPKTIWVPTSDWLKGRHDFSRYPGPVSWPCLVGSLRLFLLLRPDQGQALQSAFRGQSFRIPVPDYSALARERDFLGRILSLAKRNWFGWKSRTISVGGLVGLATQLRVKYQAELSVLLERAVQLSGYERKRRIPRLRYLAGILTYLANDGSLMGFASAAARVSELYLHSAVMKAVGSGEIDDILSLGTNAAQAAAQPLLVAGKQCSISTQIDSDEKRQALAIFLFNGVPVTLPEKFSFEQSELLRFALFGADIALMRSVDPYIREIACLHGPEATPRHAEMLRTAFDEDQELAMDAIGQLQESASP